MKTVSQLNAQGYFIGAVDADKSPLEEGVFLIPGGAVDMDPPNVPDGSLARFSDGQWVIEAAPTPSVEPEPIPHIETTAEKLVRLDAENTLTQRNLRDTIMLMNEAFKTLSQGALDLSQIPGVAKVYEVEAQAAALRAQL